MTLKYKNEKKLRRKRLSKCRSKKGPEKYQKKNTNRSGRWYRGRAMWKQTLKQQVVQEKENTYDQTDLNVSETLSLLAVSERIIRKPVSDKADIGSIPETEFESSETFFQKGVLVGVFGEYYMDDA